VGCPLNTSKFSCPINGKAYPLPRKKVVKKANPIKKSPIKENPTKENPMKENPIKENPTKENPMKESPKKEQVPITNKNNK
jgi:hypothetical protein